MFKIFDIRGAKAAAILKEKTNVQIKDFIKQIEQSDGAAKNMARIMMEGLPGAIIVFTSLFQNMTIMMGDSVKDELAAVAGALSRLIKWFGEHPKIMKFTTVAIMLTAALFAVLVPLGFLISGIGSVVNLLGSKMLLGAIKGVGSALMTLLANPVGLVIAAIALLVVGGYMLIKHWEKVKAFFVKMAGVFDGLPRPIKALIAVFMPFVAIPLMIYNNWGKVVGVWKNFHGMLDRMPMSLKVLITLLMPAIALPIALARNWKFVKNVLSVTWEFLKLTAVDLYSIGKNLVVKFGELFKKTGGLIALFIPVLGVFMTAGYQIYKNWDKIKGALLIAFDAIKKGLYSVFTFFDSVGAKILSFFGSVVEKIINGVGWIAEKIGILTENELAQLKEFSQGIGNLGADTGKAITAQKEVIIENRQSMNTSVNGEIRVSAAKGSKVDSSSISVGNTGRNLAMAGGW